MERKKILPIALAFILSTSLFGCKKDEKVTLKPIEKEIEQVVDGNLVYDTLTERISPKLSYKEGNNYKKWKGQIKEKFIQLFGIDKFQQNACPLNVKIEESVEVASTEDTPAYTRYRFLFDSEYGATVPCYLLVPQAEGKYPLAITLQGHAEDGFANSVGIALTEASMEYANGRGAFALQALRNGYIALAIEQRGMGERYARSKPEGASMCEYAANQELIRGRTILGGRVWDVSKAIDALSDSALKTIVTKINLKDITVTGNSGGGTASYYAACYDERITTCAPSCGFSSYAESIMNTYHCSCNFVPGVYEWFDMQDLACLIAPRKLVIIAGGQDNIFPYMGSYKGYVTVEEIYNKAGAKGKCNYVRTPKGHYWCEDIVWNAINEIRG